MSINLKGCNEFNSNRCVASGNLLEVARKLKEIIDQDVEASILIFGDDTSELVEMDFRGTMKDVVERYKTATAGSRSAKGSSERSQSRPGRPKLGVVARGITLLPRHWDWLNSHPGGASVALRKLVEESRRVNSSKDKIRHSQEVAYRFMSAIAGNFPGFEKATRALFACDSERFNSLVALWSNDIRDHARRLAEAAFQNRV